VCGKASVDAVRVASSFSAGESKLTVSSALLHGLQEKLRGHQHVFDVTGGLHASALFDAKGELLMVREDVGRHNALDKVIGAAFLQRLIPLRNSLLMLSGRISFELVQKASMAGIPIVVAIGAPSTLAVSLAEECGITLVGFLRDNRFTVYCGQQRMTT
jgi:FdhD protein